MFVLCTASSTRRKRESVATDALRAAASSSSSFGSPGASRCTNTERDNTWSNARQVTVGWDSAISSSRR